MMFKIAFKSSLLPSFNHFKQSFASAQLFLPRIAFITTNPQTEDAGGTSVFLKFSLSDLKYSENICSFPWLFTTLIPEYTSWVITVSFESCFWIMYVNYVVVLLRHAPLCFHVSRGARVCGVLKQEFPVLAMVKPYMCDECA